MKSPGPTSGKPARSRVNVRTFATRTNTGALSFFAMVFFLFSAFARLLERLLQHKLHHAGLHRERCYCHNLARILVGGELLEHTVRQICPGGKLSSYVIFSHLIVSDGWRLKETRGPDDRPVKIAIHKQRFQLFHICIQRPPNTVNNDRFEDFLKDETSPSIMVSSLRIGRTRTHTDKATNAVVVHG